MKQLGRIFSSGSFFIFTSLLYGQGQNGFKWYIVVPWVFAFLIFLLALIPYLKRRKDAKNKKKAELEAEKEFKDEVRIKEGRTAEQIYRAALKEELGTLNLLGTPDIDSKPVKLEDAFVSLCISESWRSDKRFEKPENVRICTIRHWIIC